MLGTRYAEHSLGHVLRIKNRWSQNTLSLVACMCFLQCMLLTTTTTTATKLVLMLKCTSSTYSMNVLRVLFIQEREKKLIKH